MFETFAVPKRDSSLLAKQTKLYQVCFKNDTITMTKNTKIGNYNVKLDAR